MTDRCPTSPRVCSPPHMEGELCRMRTGGKINLFLYVKDRRPDGYHELETLFLPLPEPWDEIRIRAGHRPGLTVRCTVPGIDPENNTLTKAWRLYAETTHFAPALEVELIKGIPHGAGLGGGSADAALILRFLQEKTDRPLPESDLNVLAAKVGADVPFFLHNRPCLATGIGEKLRFCPPAELACLKDLWINLMCPNSHISTAWAFAALDSMRESPPVPLTRKKGTDKNHCSVFSGDRAEQHRLFVHNDFEPAVLAAYPQLAELKQRLLHEGAVAAGMSGSGSSLFGFWQDREAAQQAADRLREQQGTQKDGPACMVFGPMLPGSCLFQAMPEQ